MISVFEIFKIGVGPSSSHTLGPWQAARSFVKELSHKNILAQIKGINVYLYGSLALTGKGHYTDKAVMFGLMGLDPAKVDTAGLQKIEVEIIEKRQLYISESIAVSFSPADNIKFLTKESLPYHPNGMRFETVMDDGKTVEQIYYSIGGGFIIKDGEDETGGRAEYAVPYNYSTADELQAICERNHLLISDLVWENEKCLSGENEIRSKLLDIWKVMRESAYEGCHTEGVLPGPLKVHRRASEINKQLLRVHQYSNSLEWMEAMKVGRDFKKVITRVSCLAMAVNEVNAAMGRIVTAPTNGSAGVIPAVLFYYICFSGRDTTDDDIIRFLLTAAEIGKLFKKGATISAAAGGCQAEIGVSSSMAAAALTERMGGSVAQCLMAAEIAAEHHLGMTCDPVAGLVQIPCIERNSMGAIKAITAAMIALAGDPSNAKVSLDNVIKVMKETADNMHTKYKETSLGGLAVEVGVNLPEC